jgi:hypothetical protein
VALQSLFDEIFGENGNVFRALSERRNLKVKSLQAVREVFAKESPRHLFLAVSQYRQRACKTLCK